MSVLVVVAHPDDESLGMGGTIAKWTATGTDVAVLALTDGEGARSSAAVQHREAQFSAACTVLGARPLPSVRWPDQRLDTVPILDITQAIEAVSQIEQPDTICTHIESELNLDHVITARAARIAARRLPRVYGFHVPSSPLMGPCRPTLFVDIGETIGTKIEAIECYGGEVAADPVRRSEAAIRDAAGAWRDDTGLPHVEAFEVIREIR